MLQSMLQSMLQCDKGNSISSKNYKYRCNSKDSQSGLLTSTNLELTGSNGEPASIVTGFCRGLCLCMLTRLNLLTFQARRPSTLRPRVVVVVLYKL